LEITMVSSACDLTIRRVFGVLACAILFSAGAGRADKKDENANVRTVQGVVSDAQGQYVNGAVVQLKNTKTLQIRSFITRDNGSYYFHGLSTDVDYELRADYSGASSAEKTLSSFDSRKTAVMNLKLRAKK
jgi:Carboxypeptidase regulatory-like domain